MANRWGNSGNSVRLILGGSKITADGGISHEIKRWLLLGRKVMTNLNSKFKSRDITNKGPSSQGHGFSIGHGWMWKLDCEESWALKNWWFWTVVLEKTLESPLDCKEIQSVHSKDQSWVFFGSVTWVYVPRFFVSSQQRFGVTDIKAPSVCRSSQLRSWIDCVIALRSRMGHVISLRQISVTALFYLENSRKIHLWGVRAHRSLALLFICLSLPGSVLCKLGQPGELLVLPEVLGPSFVSFSKAFPFLVL